MCLRPYANFGLKLSSEDNSAIKEKNNDYSRSKILKKKNNVIDFTKYKKSN